MLPHDDALRTGAAFWPLKSGLVATYPSLDHDEQCEVAIIGAGITGALVAERLSEAGCNVVVVDRHDAGFGSTAASTGLLMYETDVELGELVEGVGESRAVASWRAGRRAIDEIASFSQRPDPIACGFHRRPSLYLAVTRSDARRLRAECELRRRHGFAAEWLDARTVRREVGIPSHGGIWSEGDGEVDPYRLTHRLLGRAVAAGARVYDRTGVDDVSTTAHGVRLRTDRGVTIAASRLVVASGYRADTEVAPRTGQRSSTWVIVTEPIADLSWWRDRALVWDASRPYTYLRTTEDQRILVGGEDEPWAKAHTDRRTLERKAEQLLRQLVRTFPGLRSEVAYAWAGTFTTTPDGLPYIGTHPRFPHTWFALGYGGNGITFSVMAASQARAWWRGDPLDGLFAFDRGR